MIDLVAALGAVVGALDDAGAEYVVVGSVAGAAWGVARATRDVDIVTILTDDGLELLLTRLDPEAFYVPVASAREAVATQRGTFNVLHAASGGKVDLFIARSDDAFTRSRLSRRVRVEVLGITTWVATPEDVVLAKLRWRLVTRSEVQWRDCVEVAAVNDLDLAYLCEWAPELGVVDDLAELLAAVGRV